MVLIVIEAEQVATPEGVFVKTLFNYLGWKEEDFRILPTRGYTNIRNVVPILLSNTQEGGKNLIIFDADYPENGGGYGERKKWLETELSKNSVEYELFLWPDNQSDGDVEVLMEQLARKDKFPEFFSCFAKYERCISSRKKEDGITPFYTSPNRKGKLATFVSSIPLTNRRRHNLGHGEWMFDNPDIWDLSQIKLLPIGHYIKAHQPEK